ncbi:unnamed protein product [Adineta steineri]|uniref:Uncharacterized protein n=1 Tax=Adineta steineri TaxID=433720 RepID=A0A814S9M8_9BILA|nr:unnamed protein product [Adineta steineri]CAF1454586.1 unnamed protein product [Adineta steineri]
MNQYPINKDSYPPSIESIRIVNEFLPASLPPSRKIIIERQNRQFSPLSDSASRSIKYFPSQAASPSSHHPNIGSVTPT